MSQPGQACIPSDFSTQGCQKPSSCGRIRDHGDNGERDWDSPSRPCCPQSGFPESEHGHDRARPRIGAEGLRSKTDPSIFFSFSKPPGFSSPLLLPVPLSPKLGERARVRGEYRWPIRSLLKYKSLRFVGAGFTRLSLGPPAFRRDPPKTKSHEPSRYQQGKTFVACL